MERGTLPAEAMEWPLVGREEELARIEELRRGGTVPGVVLVAAAGVGKSSLARHAVAAAQRDGAFTGWVQATRSAATIPLGALAALLPDDAGVRRAARADARRGRALRERAAGRPVVLGIDDAQLLDPASAAMVLHLVMSGTAFVVATVRTGEPLPDAVEELWKDAGAARLELGLLDEAAHGRLVETVLGGAGRGGRAALDARPQPRQHALRPRAAARRARRRRARGPPRLLAARTAPAAERVARRHDRRRGWASSAGRSSARSSCSRSASRCAWRRWRRWWASRRSPRSTSAG